MFRNILVFILLTPFLINCAGAQKSIHTTEQQSIEVGAEQLSEYLPLLKNKRIAIIANPSSLVGTTHLVDTLLSLGIDIKKVMSPEHGFRGNVSAGEHIADGKDSKTGLPIISLYGAHKKPTKEDLQDIDIIIFDLQDVGTRFYTYLSTLHLSMEACGENNKTMIVLDRPNPNGYYIDGPILEEKYKSFVGLDPIPIVHGMTLGEYAQMLNGEKWLENDVQCKLKVIKIKNYDHSMSYNLPVRPSPNLPNNISINLYPSLCLFEGTKVSIGRGTQRPFQMYGYTSFEKYDTTFTPEPITGVSARPKLKGMLCKGYTLIHYTNEEAQKQGKINLSWLIDAYEQSGKADDFFNNFFYKLAGTAELRKQIEDGKTEAEIRKSWQPGLDKFKLIRAKYVLYN